MSAPFELRSATVTLGAIVALEDVDLTLRPGEFLALLGANGSGKSTLVRALLGLVPLQDGDLRIFERPLSAFREWWRVGYVPQRLAAAPATPASVLEVVLSGRIARSRRLRPYSRVDRAAALQAIEEVDLSERMHTPIGELSGGQQQRALLGRALAGEPEALLLDEPVAAVDLDHQERLAATLRRINERGCAVLLVAHSLGAMEELIAREVVLEGGRVVYEGPHLPHHIHADVHHEHQVVADSALDRATRRY